MGVIASPDTFHGTVCWTDCSGWYKWGHHSSGLLSLCGDPQMAGGFPSQRANNAESISMPWCQHDKGPVHKGILLGWVGNLQSDLWTAALVQTIWSVILNNILCSTVTKSKSLAGGRTFEKIVFNFAVSTVPPDASTPLTAMSFAGPNGDQDLFSLQKVTWRANSYFCIYWETKCSLL